MKRVTLLRATREKTHKFFVTKEVLVAILDLTHKGEEGKPINLFVQKVRIYAELGYADWSWLRPEIKQVFRISTSSNDRGRIIGFFDGKDFVAIEYFLKRKHNLGPTERAAVERVAKVKRDGTWKKVAEDELDG